MFNHNFDDIITKGLAGSGEKYKEPRDDNNSDQEGLDLSREPDIGHLAADSILEEKHLRELQMENERNELERIEKIREEDHEDLIRTYRRDKKRVQN